MISRIIFDLLDLLLADVRRLQRRADQLDRLLDLMRDHPRASGADFLDSFERWESADE